MLCLTLQNKKADIKSAFFFEFSLIAKIMDMEILNTIVTLVVGLTAFLVYKASKRHEKASAATIIVMDIRHAESVVQSILDKGSVDILTKDVLSENNWSKYKHLFAKDFSQDNFVAFNRFFESCVEMSDARKRIREVFYTSISTKARILQEKIYSLEDFDLDSGQEKIQKYFDQINTGGPIFDPDEPRSRMLNNLQMMGRLTNTTAFEKLKKLSNN